MICFPRIKPVRLGWTGRVEGPGSLESGHGPGFHGEGAVGERAADAASENFRRHTGEGKGKQQGEGKGKGEEIEKGRLSLRAKRRGREFRVFAATGGDGGGGGRGGARRGTRCWQPGALFPALAFAGKLRAFFLPH